MTIQYSSEQLQRKFSGPPGTPGFSRLGEVLRIEGRLDEAIQICQDGLRARPFQLSGYLVLGKALIDSGRMEEAKTQFESALRLDSRCLSAMRYLADIMNKMNATESASTYYRSILVLEPWDAEIRALLADALQSLPAADASPQMAEDTFQKPEGLVGDVLEVNFSEVADYLPEQSAESLDASESDDLNLELAKEASLLSNIEPVTSPALVESQDSPPISGNDVQDRLDALFGMDEIKSDAPPAPVEAWVPPELPKRDSSLPDFSESAATAINTPQPETLTQTEIKKASETQETLAIQEAAITQEASLESLAETQSIHEDQVSGEDIENRLDALFSLNEDAPNPITETSTLKPQEMELPKPPATLPSDPGTTEAPMGELLDLEAPTLVNLPAQLDLDDEMKLGHETSTDRLREAAAATWSPSDTDLSLPISGSMMSTESMLPVGWLADSGQKPEVTGSDIEAQLDKLFDLEGHSDAMDSQVQAPRLEDDPVLNHDPVLDQDQTITMPAMRDSAVKEGVTDWLMRQAEEKDGSDNFPPLSNKPFGNGAETLILSVEETNPEMPSEPEILGTLAPEDSQTLTDTVTIEMVDGKDVADRLDELFTDEMSATETIGMERPTEETLSPASGILETSDSEPMVTGDEVASRLSDIFETEAEKAQKPLKPLVPMQDEEDALTEDAEEAEGAEEEMPPQTEGGANVATVTLAEIYFQQGLKEQALQIYRQLLDREPENESVQKRISDIEASKSEGENRGSEPDPRRTRPGLKVPKRKK